jgi:hypothetical protein
LRDILTLSISDVDLVTRLRVRVCDFTLNEVDMNSGRQFVLVGCFEASHVVVVIMLKRDARGLRTLTGKFDSSVCGFALLRP